jgi:branched-chain amino acid transport system permease protein
MCCTERTLDQEPSLPSNAKDWVMRTLQAVLGGLTFGSIYALMAMGFNIVYRPTNAFNFAQGAFVTIGTLAFASMWLGGVPWWGAFFLALALAAGLGFACWGTAIGPVLKRSPHGHAWIITTLAFSLILTNIVGRLWDDQPRIVAPPPPLSNDRFTVAGLVTSNYRLSLIIITILAVLVVDAAYRTRLGSAIRAVSEDREAAELRGIRPSRMDAISVMIGAMFAVATGILAAPLLFADVSMGFPLLIKGFAAAALGGLGYNTGALIGGYVIGITEALGALYLAPDIDLVILLGIVLVVLLLRPSGFLAVGVKRVV